MILSDFHCHLYTYDSGRAMDDILSGINGFTAGMLFNNIRESDLWERGALHCRNYGSEQTGPEVVPFIGIHPWDTASAYADADDGFPAGKLEKLEQTASEAGAFIGEIGLDRLRGGNRDKQVYVFTRALDIALKTEKPFTVHCVREWGALTEILEKRKNLIKAPFIVHAWSGSAETMKNINALGGYISFGTGRSGNFSNKASECLKRIDPRFLLFETDFTCPHGNPTDYNGALTSVYMKAAEILGTDITGLSGVTEGNGKIFKAYTAYRQ